MNIHVNVGCEIVDFDRGVCERVSVLSGLSTSWYTRQEIKNGYLDLHGASAERKEVPHNDPQGAVNTCQRKSRREDGV